MTPIPELIKIGLLEDNKEVASMLKDMINQSGDLSCTLVYHNAEDAIKFIPHSHLDMLIVDINLPGINGIEAIKQLSILKPDLLFCVFTVYEDDDKIFSALENGAKGYILKTTAKPRLMESLRELYHGGSPMSSNIARRVIEKLYAPKSANNESELPISKRENMLLSLLSQGFTYRDIGEKLFIAEGTVKQHLHKIYTKLHVSNKTQAINRFNSNK